MKSVYLSFIVVWFLEPAIVFAQNSVAEKGKKVIEISAFKDVLIAMPATFTCKEVSIGMGEDYVIVKKINEQLISVKAQPGLDFPPTNMIILSDSGVFNVNVILNHGTDRYFYQLNSDDFIRLKSALGEKAEKVKKEKIEGDLSKDSEDINRDYFLTNRCTEGMIKSNVVMVVNNIGASYAYIYISILIQNRSKIKYDFNYASFFIEKKNLKKGVMTLKGGNTALDSYLLPVGSEEPNNEEILPKETHVFVYRIKKFALNPKEVLKVNVQEKNGSRAGEIKISASTFNRIVTLINEEA